MNFKRVAALLLAGAMVMTAVPVYAKGDDVTLSVSIWDTNQEPGIKEILADFTEKTGIKTEISVVKWDEYWTMLEAGAQGGSLPDVFWMHSNESQRYMSNDMLLDLTDSPNKNADGIKNTEKYLLFNDPFMGILDSTLVGDEGEKFAKAARKLVYAKNEPEWGYLFRTLYALCDALAIKANLGQRIRAAYSAKDKAALLAEADN